MNIERLPLDIVDAHENFGFQPEQGADHRGRDAMLARASLRDQAALAHPLGEEALRQHLVGLVRAAVEQILALQIQAAMADIGAARERGGPTGIGRQQRLQFGDECRILLGIEERALQLLERGQQDFGYIAAAEFPEPSI